MVYRVIVPPLMKGTTGHDACYRSQHLIRLATGKEGTVTAVMEDDENPDQQTGGHGGQGQGQPVGDGQTPISSVPEQKERNKGIDDLPDTSQHIWLSIRCDQFLPVDPFLMVYRQKNSLPIIKIRDFDLGFYHSLHINVSRVKKQW